MPSQYPYGRTSGCRSSLARAGSRTLPGAGRTRTTPPGRGPHPGSPGTTTTTTTATRRRRRSPPGVPGAPGTPRRPWTAQAPGRSPWPGPRRRGPPARRGRPSATTTTRRGGPGRTTTGTRRTRGGPPGAAGAPGEARTDKGDDVDAGRKTGEDHDGDAADAAGPAGGAGGAKVTGAAVDGTAPGDEPSAGTEKAEAAGAVEAQADDGDAA